MLCGGPHSARAPRGDLPLTSSAARGLRGASWPAPRWGKGGIGTSSRMLPQSDGGYRIGVLVQTNYGGRLTIEGLPVARVSPPSTTSQLHRPANADGSIIIVVATDAPLSDRALTRLGKRAMAGLARTGAAFSNGSGDYAISFSTAPSVRRTPARREALATVSELPNDRMTPLFVAVAEATEEAILNSLLKAVPMSGVDASTDKPSSVPALNGAKLKAMLKQADEKVRARPSPD